MGFLQALLLTVLVTFSTNDDAFAQDSGDDFSGSGSGSGSGSVDVNMINAVLGALNQLNVDITDAATVAHLAEVFQNLANDIQGVGSAEDKSEKYQECWSQNGVYLCWKKALRSDRQEDADGGSSSVDVDSVLGAFDQLGIDISKLPPNSPNIDLLNEAIQNLADSIAEGLGSAAVEETRGDIAYPEENQKISEKVLCKYNQAANSYTCTGTPQCRPSPCRKAEQLSTKEALEIEMSKMLPLLLEARKALRSVQNCKWQGSSIVCTTEPLYQTGKADETEEHSTKELLKNEMSRKLEARKALRSDAGQRRRLSLLRELLKKN